jgi:hypothetical protein
VRCTKCASELVIATTEPVATSRSPAISSPKTGPSLSAALRKSPLVDADWQLEADLRGVHRLISSLKSRSPQQAGAPTKAFQTPAVRPLDTSRNSMAIPRASASQMIGWIVLSLGLAAFACGAVLLGWSFAAERDDLRALGMPLALLGQAGLILGLVLQLDGLWSASRKTASVLHELDDELKNVRQATTLLSSSHSTSGQSFYLHLAEGASPHLLLTDLKGQLDLLAQEMSRRGCP